ncbi:MAG: DUF58 domain-containing protein [Candidatus Omnitrophica bacterium]|nr:DUF58 domain-containing protein [Candidatus Omnitrophota bacterium]MDD5670907.1 DUF58 domain-containing protein [Candidatus Omnitrophota bacterium]
MIPKEILKKVRHIEIRTTRLVNDLFGGEYQSVFKGQGIEFADVREYVPGDDIRTIDWNVTARSQHPFVKKFVEERELTVLFVVDMSGSQYFGSGERLKAEVAAEITALLSFSAVKNNDKTGLVIVTDEVEKNIPVKKGKTHVLRVVREILYYKPKGRKTNLSKALEYLHNFLTRTAVIFLISDFMDQGYEKALKILSRRHDVIAIHLKDRREEDLPPIGLVEVEDCETGQSSLADFSRKSLRQMYQQEAVARNEKLDHLLKTLGIDRIDISAECSYVEPIMKFFKIRERRM